MNPSSPESTGSESDPEYMENKFSIKSEFHASIFVLDSHSKFIFYENKDI